MKRVIWLRHGPTHETRFVGWRDVPADLSDGPALARLGAFLPQEAALVSSDLIRARDTAAALGRGAPQEIRALREFNLGAWDGLSFEEINARDPQLCREYWERPGDVAPPDGESWNAVAARVSGAVDTLLAQHDVVIAVAHVGVILTQLARVLEGGAEAALSQKIDNLSVTELICDAGVWRAGSVNHCP